MDIQNFIENIDLLNETQLRELLKAEREHSVAIIRMLNEQLATLGALRHSYETMLQIDIRDLSFVVIQATPEVRYASSQVKNVLQLGALFCQNFVVPEYQKLFMEFVNEGTLANRMAANKYLACEYMTKNIGWCQAKILPIEIDSDGHVIKALFTTETESEHHATLSVLRVAAYQDALTGIANRFSGEQKIREALGDGKDAVYALMDCDSFKKINDTLGHPTGDVVLIEVAKALSDVFGHDNVMRLGGDEFVAFTNDKKNIDLVREKGFGYIYEKLHERLKLIEIPKLKSRYPSLSCGAVIIPAGSSPDISEIYTRADQNLYKVKTSHDGAFLCTEI